jgi:hypothetical protein
MILLIAILANALSAYSQVDLKKKITIEIDNGRLEDVLAWLQTYHDIKFSYGFDNVSPDIRITLHAKNTSVYEIIHTICQQGNLIFQIIDSTVVFKHEKSPNQSVTVRDNNPLKIENSINRNNIKNNVTALDKADSIPAQQKKDDNNPLLTDISPLEQQEVKPPDMKLAEKPSLFHSSGKFRRKIAIQTGVFFSYASDFNRFEFLERDIASQKFNVEWNESYSFGGYMLLSKKLYISLGATYVSKNFHLHYNYKVLDLSDPFPVPDKTSVKLYYLETPLTFGYALTSWKKYSVMVATGLYPSFLLREAERTTYQNQGNPNTNYFLNANRSTLFSASLGFIIHRYLNRSCGIFIEPGYLYFFGPVNEQAMNSRSSLLRLKMGIQFALSGKK